MKIAHVLNPFKCGKDNPSYLYYAQPITFKSMRNAQLEAKKENIDVELYAANFPEDDEIIPEYFIKLPHLKKSTKTLFPGISGNKKLPIIQEMLDLTFKHSDADYIIFTNSDIGVQKNFYIIVNKLIKKYNYTSLIINRRDIKKKNNGIRLTDKDEFMNIIYNLVKSGRKHPGRDCFVMKRNLITKINFDNMFIGYPPWGYTLHKKLLRISKNHKILWNSQLTFHLGSDRAWSKEFNPLRKKNKQISRIVLRDKNIRNIRNNINNNIDKSKKKLNKKRKSEKIKGRFINIRNNFLIQKRKRLKQILKRRKRLKQILLRKKLQQRRRKGQQYRRKRQQYRRKRLLL
jgi:hypothetical protein